MAISYVGIGTRVDAGSGTKTLAYPVDAVSGDYLVACVHRRSSAVAAPVPSNTLTWTDTGAASIYHKVYTATYDGLATAPTIDTSVTTYGVMFALRCSNAIVVDAIADESAASAQVNMHYPALSLGNDNEFVFTYCRNNSAITSVAVDSGFTEIEDFSMVTSGACGVHIQYQIQNLRANIAMGNPVVTGGSSVATHGITLAFTEGPYVPAAGRTLLLGVG